MGLPIWGQQLLKKQDEQSATLGVQSGKLDQLLASVGDLRARVDRHDEFHADLMIFLREQFDEVRRHMDVAVENMRSDNRSDNRVYWEQQREHNRQLERQSGRLDKLEENEKVTTVSVRGLIARVGALKKQKDSVEGHTP
jgi:hypothetical protein